MFLDLFLLFLLLFLLLLLQIQTLPKQGLCLVEIPTRHVHRGPVIPTGQRVGMRRAEFLVIGLGQALQEGLGLVMAAGFVQQPGQMRRDFQRVGVQGTQEVGALLDTLLVQTLGLVVLFFFKVVVQGHVVEFGKEGRVGVVTATKGASQWFHH